ncbi:MAG: hypothetical protein OXE85_02065 [Roseovarius sp.]|nr:hypothetical protein [Roseovarius sp.]
MEHALLGVMMSPTVISPANRALMGFSIIVTFATITSRRLAQALRVPGCVCLEHCCHSGLPDRFAPCKDGDGIFDFHLPLPQKLPGFFSCIIRLKFSFCQADVKKKASN